MALPYYVTWTAQKKAVTLPVTGAEGAYFHLEDGKKVLDLISTSYQTSFGHNHSQITGAISDQLGKMPVAAPKAAFELKTEVSNRLIELLDLGGGKIFYTVSGAESVENALKMARLMSGKTQVACRSNSYHGASLGALSVTGDWRNEPHATVDDWTVRIPEPSEDADFLQAQKSIEAAGDVAAIIVETVTGANGVHRAPKSWWTAARKYCDQKKIFLIADEVLCGFGRVGKAFGFQREGIQPDMVCMAKAISGGYVPFGAVWTSPWIADYFEDNVLSCGLTSYAHPLGLAALSGVLDILQGDGFWNEYDQLAAAFKSSLGQLSELSSVSAVRVEGMLAAVETTHKKLESRYLEFVQGGAHLHCKGNLLVLAPPFVTSENDLKQAIQMLAQKLDSF